MILLSPLGAREAPSASAGTEGKESGRAARSEEGRRAGDGRGKELRKDPPRPVKSVELRVAAPRVYRGTDVLLRAVPEPAARCRSRWDASAGTLRVDDRLEAYWLPPDRTGRVELRVDVWPEDAPPDAAPAASALRVVEVDEPSTEGMARIPGGIFTIGDTWSDLDDPEFIETVQNKADKPPHRVRLTPYFIDRDRVTNREYVAFLEEALAFDLIEVTPIAVWGAHPSEPGGAKVPFLRFSHADLADVEGSLPSLRKSIRRDGSGFVIEEGHEDHPVVDVTWAGADAFARFYGKRLPTNAEWELAARGKDGRRFPWGDEIPTPLHANVNGYYGDRLLPVRSFSPTGDSPYGVRDMVGGVFEWVSDWFNENYYEKIASEEPVEDPQGPHWGRDHVLRGVPGTFGLYGSPQEQPPLSFRYQWFFEFPDAGDSVATHDTGFRTAMTDDSRVDRRKKASPRQATAREGVRAAGESPAAERPTGPGGSPGIAGNEPPLKPE